MTDGQDGQRARAAGLAIEPPTGSEDGSRRGAGRRTQPRRLGSRAAANRALSLLNGKEMPPAKMALLKITGRLLVHFENISNKLYELGEVKGDDEPRALGARMLELERAIKENLQTLGLLEDAANDPLSALMQGQRR